MIPFTHSNIEEELDKNTLIALANNYYELVDTKYQRVACHKLASFGYYFCSALALTDLEGKIGLGHFLPEPDFENKVHNLKSKFKSDKPLKGIIASTDDHYKLIKACNANNIEIVDLYLGQTYISHSIKYTDRKNIIVDPWKQVVTIYTKNKPKTLSFL